MTDKDIYTMTLFEEFELDSGGKIIRVPGGWVLQMYDQEKNNVNGSWECILRCAVFIPFNDEFQKKEGGTP